MTHTPPRRRGARTDTARSVAYDALLRIEHDAAFANLVLPGLLGKSRLDTRDRAFATDLVYGTVRRQRACDFAIDCFVLTAPSTELRVLLRLGAYQLLFGDVAPHAAVDATVSLAPQRTRGFVNAILRKIAGSELAWPDEATRLSYPDWIVERLRAELGDADAHDALEHMNHPAVATTREDGYVQDLASQWVAALVDARPGERVLDLCAAPGGKATAIASTGATVVAADLRLSRTSLMAANARRLGSSIACVVADAAAPPFPAASFDRVLLDAPCSGLGVLRRRADARWRITAEALDGLVVLQQSLIDAAVTLVKPGGVFVYSVCTLTSEESVAHRFPDWAPLPPPEAPWRPFGVGGRLLPQDADTDGMTVIRLRRPD